ncbi:MAG: hypothetical protein AB8B74_13510 [Crocinitomicaceae bacterium]
MGKTNFQSLKELSNSLTKKLNKLAKGNLNLDEIEVLTDEARELYERIVVIRYKSYEESNKPAMHSDTDSNVDIKEEADIVESNEKEEDELMMFDFSADASVNEESAILPELESDGKHDIDSGINPPEKQTLGTETIDSSLNDNFKKEDGSVAAQYKQAAIEDLKEHIGINRKFLYVNELFKGDGTAYNEAITRLNTCESVEDALTILKDLGNQQSWSNDSATVSGFVAMVERRYIS